MAVVGLGEARIRDSWKADAPARVAAPGGATVVAEGLEQLGPRTHEGGLREITRIEQKTRLWPLEVLTPAPSPLCLVLRSARRGVHQRVQVLVLSAVRRLQAPMHVQPAAWVR